MGAICAVVTLLKRFGEDHDARGGRRSREDACLSWRGRCASMISKKPAPDLIRGGDRFSEKIMLHQ
jgi:hypothetical protein